MIELMSLKQFKVNKTDYYLPRDMEKLQYGHLVLMDNLTPEDNIKYLIMNEGIKKRDAYNCVYADNKIQFTAYSLVRANMTKERLVLLNKYKEATELKTVLTTSMLKGRNAYYDISVWNKMFFDKASRMGYMKKAETYFAMIRLRLNEFDSKLWKTKIVFIDARSWQASLSSDDEHIRYDNPITLLYMGMKKDFPIFKSIGDVEFVIAGDSGMFRMNPSECDDKSFNEFKKMFKRVYTGKTSDMDEEVGNPEILADYPAPEPAIKDPKADEAQALLAKNNLNNKTIGNSDITTFDDPRTLDDPKVKELIKQSKILEPVDIKSTAMSKRDEELREAQKNLKLDNGHTLNDLLKLRGDKIDVPVHDVSHKVKTANEHMTKVHFDNMAKTYNTQLYEKDLLSIADSMQNKSIPVYIRDVKKVNTSDSLNLKETLTFSLEDSERRRHTLKFDVPKFIDNRFMYLNGHKKEFNNQRFLKPIVKTGPDTVQICTNYNKIFMTRYGENVEAKFEKFKNFVLSDKKRFKAQRGDCSALNKDYKTTIEYDTLAKTFASIEVINNKKVVCTLIFNQPKLKEYFEKSKFKKLYDNAQAKGELVVGYTDKGLPLTFSDDTDQHMVTEAMGIDMDNPDWLTESVNGCLREGMYPQSPADTNVNDRMDSVRNELESLINGEGDMTPEEREARIGELKHQRQMLMSNRLVTEASNGYSNAKAVYDSLSDEDKKFVSPNGRFVDSPSLAYRYIHKSGKDVAGFVDCYKYNGKSTTSAFIVYAVTAKYRGKGISRILLNKAVSGCKALGYKKLIYKCEAKNIASSKAAQAFGFKPTRETKNQKSYELLLDKSVSESYEPVEEFFFDKKKEVPKRPANLPAENVLESEYKKAQSAVKSAMSKASPRLERCITFADTDDPSYKRYLSRGEYAVVATVVASKGYGHIDDGDDKADEYQDDYDAFFELCGDKYDHHNFQISDSGDWDDKDIVLEWFDSTKESYDPVMEADAEPLEDTTKEPVGIVDYVLAIFAESLDLGEFAKYKSGKKFMYTRCTVMKKHIPLVIFLAYCEGITTVLRKAGVKFQFSDKRTRLEGLDAVNKGMIPFQDGYLIYDKYPLHISLLMNGLSVIDTKSMDYAELDSKSIYLDIFDRLYGARMLANALDNFYEWMIDAPTIEILNDLNYPTDLVGLMLAGNKLLADNNFSDEIDMKNWRIRNNELVYAYAYKRVADAYARYRMTASNKNPVKISIPQDVVIKDIMTSQIVEDVSELSPIVEIEKGHTLTDKGPSGTNLDESYTMERRCFHPSMKGVVAMSSSPDYNVGKTRELTMEPNVVNARGYIIPPDKGDLNDVNLFSAAELLTPMGATKDDTIRTAMGSKQSRICSVYRRLYIDNLLNAGTNSLSSDY